MYKVVVKLIIKVKKIIQIKKLRFYWKPLQQSMTNLPDLKPTQVVDVFFLLYFDGDHHQNYVVNKNVSFVVKTKYNEILK